MVAMDVEVEKRASNKVDPSYLTELRRLTGDESLTLYDVEASISEATSAYNHFMTLYTSGKLPSITDAWRLIAMRMGIEPLSAEEAMGQPAIDRLRKDPDIVVKEIEYRSSVSDINPLYAEVCYDPKARNMPVAVVQHGGNPGSRFATIPSCYRMAKKGMFGLSVSKRGRDGSAGENDSWAVETFDIFDAIEYAKREYAEFVDPTNVNIWGYSGGCIDSVAAAVRFPDYFRLVAPYFGQLEWATTFGSIPKEMRRQHVAKGEEVKSNNIVDGIGGFPDEVPDHYMARDLLLGVINNPYSRMHFFLDSKDPSGPLLQGHFRDYLAKAQELGFTNVDLHLSKPEDVYRFHHIHPGAWAELGSPDLMVAESFYLSHILNRDYPEPVLADGGRMNVLGYIKTKEFFIWLGNGDNAAAELEYTLTGPEKFFMFRPLSSDPTVQGRLTVPNPEGHRWRIEVNREVVSESNEPELAAHFGLDDSVVFRRSLA